MKKLLFAFLAMFAALQTSVFAAGALTVAPLGTDDFIAVAGAVLVASALMWAVKKGLSLIRA